MRGRPLEKPLQRAAAANLTVLRVYSEPEAALAAYGLYGFALHPEHSSEEEYYLCIHFGGASFVASLYSLDNGVQERLRVTGDQVPGGNEVTRSAAEHLARLLGREVRAEPGFLSDDEITRRLWASAETAKRALSATDRTEVRVDVGDVGSRRSFSAKLSRTTLAGLCHDLFARILAAVDRLLAGEGGDDAVPKNTLHAVVLTGGSTWMPNYRQLIRDHFTGVAILDVIAPDEAAAFGVALSAERLQQREDPYEGILVDSLVPASLGIETAGGVFTKVLRRGTMFGLWIKGSIIVTTTADYQSVASIRVFEGDRATARENAFVTELDLKGIPPAKRGALRIVVTIILQFSISTSLDDIIEVHAAVVGKHNGTDIWHGAAKASVEVPFPHRSPEYYEAEAAYLERIANDDHPVAAGASDEGQPALARAGVGQVALYTEHGPETPECKVAGGGAS